MVVETEGDRSWLGFDLGLRPGRQGVMMDPATGTPLVSGAGKGEDSLGRSEPVRLVHWKDWGMREWVGELGVTAAGRPAVARQRLRDGRRLGVIPLTGQNRVSVVGVEGGARVGGLAAGQAPFGAVVSASGTTAYVSNWGGRLAIAGEATGGSNKVVADERGIAATGTLTKYDLVRMVEVATIETELHPTAMEWGEAGGRLCVANSNSDSITVVDTATDEVVRHARLQPFSQEAFGVTPAALALTADGQRLKLALAGINAVAVVRTATMEIEGLTPMGWYPISVGLDWEETRIVVGCMQGAGSGPSVNSLRKSVHAVRGSVQVVPIPTSGQLRDYSRAVAVNSRSILAEDAGTSGGESGFEAGAPIPACVGGGGSPIKKVVFVIQENRTYDQVLGDLGRGNGEASLAIYGGRVIPNQRKLAGGDAGQLLCDGNCERGGAPVADAGVCDELYAMAGLRGAVVSV